MTEEEVIEKAIQEEVSDHTKLVRLCEKKIHSLGLITFGKTRQWAGFIPDIVTNVAGRKSHWVLVEIVNSQESLFRDIGGLLIAKANIERNGIDKVRAIVALHSKNVTETKAVEQIVHEHCLKPHEELMYCVPFDLFHLESILHYLSLDAHRALLSQSEDWEADSYWNRAKRVLAHREETENPPEVTQQ
jgi:hypothetical protein